MSENKVEYKDTLNLPKTDFPMKAGLAEKEPAMLNHWLDKNIYEKMISKNSENFSMPDGPPYANGNIHVGHALNKLLKDFVIKYRNMAGKSAVFIPGWDCHGLPIELGVTKKLGSKRKEIDDNQFREHCREFAMTWVNTQREQFKRLGVLADWENPYLTLQKEYEAEEVRQLAKMVETGAFYKGEKPVFWCWALQTALADTEVEYQDHVSPSIYVKFNIKDDKAKFSKLDKPVSFVIWTTTPWTLPANLGICLNENFEYGLYEHNNEYLIFAKGLHEAIEKDTELSFKEVPNLSFKGSELEGMIAQHPFIDRESKVILGPHVTLEAGTGCVHTAPGHGADDYMVGRQYGLEVYSPVNEFGKFNSDVPEYEGMLVFDANPLIIERLTKSNHLIHHHDFKHSYPHCWRTKKPLIYRATTQWFLKMDLEENSIRQKSLNAIKEVNFVPAWGENRITAMIENRPDWCLSRQRLWGVPIPVFHCQDCGDSLVDPDIMRKVADAMEADNGINTYFSTDEKEFLGDKKCKCGSSNLSKGKDILDVWFDSGVCHAAVQEKRDGLLEHADLYLEGSDQHRGWFQTSLLTSIATRGHAPFKTVLTHGFVNDLNGRKMSKSLGNVVDPAKVIEKYGAEILRLWASYEDYSQDLTCGDESFKRLSETYRRLRNTMRFLLGNMDGFNPDSDQVEFSDMLELDRWALIRLNKLIEHCTNAYENYDFYKVYHGVNQFVTVELSATYLDILKDRLYTSGTNSKARKSAQTVLYYLCRDLCGILAPILSFLTEETYSYLPGTKEESIFLTSFPKVNSSWNSEGLEAKYDELLKFRSDATKILEDLRREKTIRSSLEAQVKVYADGQLLTYLQESKEDLADFVIVSRVEIVEGSYKVEAMKAEGEKCPRCWKFKTDIGNDSTHKEICGSCVEAVS